MNKNVKKNIPKKYRYKCKVIGDLMADIANNTDITLNLKEKKWIALLPGSKKAKLSVGIPFFLEIADHIYKDNNNCLLYTSPSPRDSDSSRMPSSA